ncbi:hypothetical protein RND71_034597 [Anisodus tanguticus]|uniref:DUF7745 domain-containing protein n=1 Tax=Anisodus tanguticus TaxID=243964 RepID=A0AAE1RBQ1_9SOLA|nr:hypothetical protein RND71_034597 [Anisodus tanguticus]
MARRTMLKKVAKGFQSLKIYVPHMTESPAKHQLRQEGCPTKAPVSASSCHFCKLYKPICFATCPTKGLFSSWRRNLQPSTSGKQLDDGVYEIVLSRLANLKNEFFSNLFVLHEHELLERNKVFLVGRYRLQRQISPESAKLTRDHKSCAPKMAAARSSSSVQILSFLFGYYGVCAASQDGEWDSEQPKIWWTNFDLGSQMAIRRRLGCLVSLFDIFPDQHLVRALIHFWDPDRVVFRFGDFEMTPTFEEIGYFTNLIYRGKGQIIPLVNPERNFSAT